MTNGTQQQCMQWQGYTTPLYWLDAYSVELEAGTEYTFNGSCSAEDGIIGVAFFVLYNESGEFNDNDNYYFSTVANVGSSTSYTFLCDESGTYVLYVAADFLGIDETATDTLNYTIICYDDFDAYLDSLEYHEVGTAQELTDAIADYNSANNADKFNIKLTADIDMTGIDFTPFDCFTTAFNGQGHTISNVAMTAEDSIENYLGFFNEVSNATIRNLNVFDASISATNISNGIFAGILAGYAENTNVSNCIVSGAVNTEMTSNNWSYVGGLFGGCINTVVNNTSADVEISGNNMVDVGGFAGGIWVDNYFVNCSSQGSIECDSATFIGGFGGYAGDNGSFVNCYTLTDLTATNAKYIGGFVGASEDKTYSNCYAGNLITVENLADVATYDGYKPASCGAFIGSDNAYDSSTDVTSTFDNCYGNFVNISENEAEYDGVSSVDFTDDDAIATLLNSLNDYVVSYEGSKLLKAWGLSETLNVPVFAKYYTVTFNDKDGNLIETMENVLEGTDLTDSAPDAPDAPGYEFTGWDADITNVTSDMVVTAVYSEVENSTEKSTNESTDVSSDESNDSTSSDESSSADNSTSSGTNPTTGATVGLSLVAIALAGVGLVIKKRK